MENTLYCPVPHTYVVAQLDIQATVRNLDAQTQEAAQKIKPAKCLLYLYDAPRFPLPGRPTTFETYIIGPSLRAEDPSNCFTADMCVPIFPNTAHPNNRPSVRTKTPFPFSNCYHWAYVDVLLRVSSGEFPGLNDPRLVRLAASEQARMDRLLTKDLTAAVLAKKERQETSPQLDYDQEEDVFTRKPKIPEELLPVVTVSVDLPGSLEETNLPDPMEFLRQYNALIRLAKESNARGKPMADDSSVHDDALSVSTSYTENDLQSSLADEHEYDETRRPGRFRRFSQAIMRALRVRQEGERVRLHLDGEEDDSVSRNFFDERSEIEIIEPIPKDSNKFPLKMFRLIRTFFQLRR